LMLVAILAGDLVPVGAATQHITYEAKRRRWQKLWLPPPISRRMSVKLIASISRDREAQDLSISSSIQMDRH
jgi:hypothetical protein